jgi:DNA polymerase-3 subunit epsilon
MRAIAIDFETANERRDSACSVGLAWIEDGAVVRRAYRLIRPPEMRFSPWNVRVHGLRPRDVADAPTLPGALAEFLPELSGTLLLAHNAAFDIGVLRAGLAAHGRPVPSFRYLCTHAVARAAWPGEESYGLAALAAKVGLVFGHHHAEEDADACARLALAAASHHGTHRIAGLMARLGLASRSVSGPPPPPRPRGAPTATCGAPSTSTRGRGSTRRTSARSSAPLPP